MSSAPEETCNIQINEKIENKQCKEEESKNDSTSLSMNSQITADNSQHTSINSFKKIESNEQEKKEIKNILEINGIRDVNKETNVINTNAINKEKKEENAQKNIKNKQNDGFTQTYSENDFSKKPPKIPDFLNAVLSYSNNVSNETKNFPNCFINHLIINNEKTKYSKVTINQRNKGKISKIIYYSP